MTLWIVFWKSLLVYWLAAASESLSVDQFRLWDDIMVESNG